MITGLMAARQPSYRAEPNIKVRQVAAVRSLRFREVYNHHIRAWWPSCLDSTGMFFAGY